MKAALIAVCAMLTTLPAEAAEQCGSRDEIVAALAARYGETRRSIGMAANAAVVEVWASEETGTWTITATLPSGLTCLLASGDAFEAVAAVPVPPGDPA